jgi:hypothetical protein
MLWIERKAAVGGGGPPPAQGLEHDGRVEPAEAGAADIVLHIEAGEAEAGRQLQRLDREDLFLVPARRVGGEFGGGEGAGGVFQRALVFREVEVHRVSASSG